MSELRVEIRRAKNGYVLQESTNYGVSGTPEVFITFQDLVKHVAHLAGETEFEGAIDHACEFSNSLSGFVEKVCAPKLLAIEAKINPGVETIVNEEEDGDVF